MDDFAITNLLHDEIPNTVQTYVFNNGKVSEILHKRNNAVIRTDAFTYATNTITETRTLNTGKKLTVVTNLSTLETTVSYTQDYPWLINYRVDGAGNAILLDKSLFYEVRSINGTTYYMGVATNESGVSSRKALAWGTGYATALTDATLTDSGVYPIPIPPTAVKFTITTDMPNAQYMATIFKYPATVDDIFKYERVSFTTWTDVSTPMTFLSDENQVLGLSLRKSDNSAFANDENYNISILFE